MGWLAGGETWTEAALEKDRRTWTQAEDALSILPNLLIGKKGHRKDVFLHSVVCGALSPGAATFGHRLLPHLQPISTRTFWRLLPGSL